MAPGEAQAYMYRLEAWQYELAGHDTGVVGSGVCKNAGGAPLKHLWLPA